MSDERITYAQEAQLLGLVHDLGGKRNWVCRECGKVPVDGWKPVVSLCYSQDGAGFERAVVQVQCSLCMMVGEMMAPQHSEEG